jgi:hypothetical protein
MLKIVQGSQAQIPIKLLSKQGDTILGPVPLGSLYDITTCFQNLDGSETTVGLVEGGLTIVGNPLLGQIQIALTAAQTELLAPSDPGQLQIALIATMGTDPVIVPIWGVYRVIPSIC